MVMSVKGLKQKVAAALIVAMTASNVLSAAAATGGIGTPSEKEVVAVTFKAGEGAGWTNIATWAKATRNDAETATKSDAVRSADEITREFVITENDELIGTDDNKNAKYINLERAGEWFKDAEWDDVDRLQNDGLKFANWYYDGGTEIGKVPVVSTTEIFNGAVLEAGWYKPANGKSEQIDVESVKAVGLPVNAKVTVRDLQDDEKETTESLNKILKREGLEITGADAVVGIDIDVDVENLTDDVTISLTAPNGLGEVKEGDGNIKAIHIRSGKSPVIYPVSVVKDGDEFHLAFTVKKEDGFSPFYFVKTAETDEVKDVKVTIENVKNGYLAAYTGNGQDATFLPIGEPVELKEGTELCLNPHGYSFSDKWIGEFESITVKFEDGTSELLEKDDRYVVEKDCTLTVKFNRVPREKEDMEQFNIWVSTNRILDEVKFEGEVHVERLNAYGNDYEEFTGWTLRMATAKDLEDNNMPEDYGESIDKFSFNSETNILTSIGGLELGSYDVPFVIHYEDKDYIISSSDWNFNYPYYAHVRLGVRLYYYTPLIDFRENHHGNPYLALKKVFDNGSLKWKDAKPTEEELAGFRYGIPKMYNYEFQGWQDYQGKPYENDDQALISRSIDPYFIYSLFTDKNGKAYNGVEPLYDGKAPAEEPDNPDTPNNPDGSNGNTSTSGRSSGSSGGGSASAARDYTMHGNWIAAENGWRFLKDSGEYAANTWGYINGLWYFFDEQGNMVTGWRYVNGQWYYMNPAAGSVQGAMMTGWVLDPTYNAWFYLTGSGAMATGWQQINGLWYYLNPVSDGTRGVMAANTYVDGYFVNADGVWVQ